MRVLRLADVIKRTRLSRTTLYNLMNAKSRYYDPSFPKRISLTGRAGGAIGFLEHEINNWISSKAA
ncbi:helix-turn-helix transcriptional regulator [Pseudomonas caricapapayae]|uniref:helix-turn-helix transcriptional regulator n=1 Tax=Pseudomonas caricapapayae TaxID=46678 RepID=UPI001CC1DCC9|nr:AlpA family phage regulatory protein [Pseudomonas caricapapayae]